MNLAENRFEKERKEALDSMGLTKKNRRLADQWMDMEQEENPELLKLMILQGFNGNRTNTWACASYFRCLKKNGRTKEAGRFVRMAAVVGGAAAGSVLTNLNGDDLEEIVSYLSGEDAREQEVAIRGKIYSVGIYKRKPSKMEKLFETGKKEPEVLLQAMKRYCKYEENAWRILAAAYLHVTKPGAAGNVANELVDSLLKAVSDMGRGFSKWDLERMEAYVRDTNLEQPFPQGIYRICWEKGNPSMYTGVCGACAFLAAFHSPCLEKFVRLMVGLELRYSSRGIVLSSCMDVVEESWYHKQMDRLEDMLPIEEDSYVLWCVSQKCRQTLGRMAAKCPDAVERFGSKCAWKDYEYIMGELKQQNLSLYEKMSVSYEKNWKEKWAKEMVSRIYPGREEARAYLLGQTLAEVLLPFAKDWGDSWDGFGDEERMGLIQVAKDWGDEGLYERAIVLEAFLRDTNFFEHEWIGRKENLKENKPENPELANLRQIQWMLSVFCKEQLSLSCQIHLLAGLGESIQNKGKKPLYLEQCKKALISMRTVWKQDEWEFGLGEAAKEGSSCGRCFGIQMLDFCMTWEMNQEEDLEAYRKQIFSAASSGPKQVQRTLFEVLAGHREWESEILDLLASKKLGERELAVGILEEWGGCSSLEKVKEAAVREKSKKLKQRLEEIVSSENKPATGKAMDRLAAELLGFGKKRRVEWTKNISFPKLHRWDGEEVSEEYRTAIFAAYADMDLPGLDGRVSRLASELDQKDLSSSMAALLDEWLREGAEAKKRWVLYAAAIHGGEALVPVLCRQIDAWSKHSRGVMAGEAARALVLGGTTEALLWADKASRSHKSRQVKKAALEALSEAAKVLGIHPEELEDRIVPTLGFDQNRERMFDYGTRKFRAVLTFSLEVEIFDETGKQLKHIPAPGKKDEDLKASEAYGSFKKMKKQLKDVAASQKQRLERVLTTERQWSADSWKALFVNNPVMNLFAWGLIWGRYEGDVLMETFRYMEDGSFNTAEETLYEFPKEGTIGLIHPVELSKQLLEKWREQLSDYQVAQPFLQIDRPVYRPKEKEKKEGQLTRFQGRTVNGFSLAGKLLRQGWMRGLAEGGGFYHSFFYRDGDMEAELEFSGSLVGAEMEEVAIGKLGFYRWEENKGEKNTKKNCILMEVKPRYFSEVVKMVEEIFSVF